MNQKVLVLGSATRNGTCNNGICDGNALYGDKKVMEFDWDTNSWKRREDMAGNLRKKIHKYCFLSKFSESRLAYTSALELPKKVCDSFSETDKELEDLAIDLDDDIKHFESGNNGITDSSNEAVSESDLSSESSNEAHSISELSSGSSNEANTHSESNFESNKEEDSDSSIGSSNEGRSDSDVSTGPINGKPSESDSSNDNSNAVESENKVSNNDVSNDLTNSETVKSNGSKNSDGVNSDVNSGSDNEKSGGTQNQITIQNYGYESEAVLKSTACSYPYKPFEILLLITVIKKVLF